MTAQFNAELLRQSLAALIPPFPRAQLCIALSGGLDSVALLHAAHELAGREPGLALRAVHVDHGLQPQSGSWAAHCATTCAGLGVPLTVIGLRLAIGKGASVEAEARSARYVALAGALQQGEWLLTAQHADDQFETVLLQLLRGAGVAGLAAMPDAAPLGRGTHLRPLLDVTRAGLQAYAADAGLAWIEDPMNEDSCYDRAWLRHAILPALRARFPSAARTIGRSARHFAEAQVLLEALADADAAPLLAGGRLVVAPLLALPRPRQVNVLRRWLATRGLGAPSAAKLETILDTVLAARVDAVPRVSWATGEVRRYRGRLYAMAPLGPQPDPAWHGDIAPGGTLPLPNGLGALSLRPSAGQGIPVGALRGPLSVRFRRGGERLRPVGRGPVAHTLKNLCQEAGIVPWMRSRLPLLFVGSRLAAVGDLWVDAELAAAPGEAACAPVWDGRPDPF